MGFYFLGGITTARQYGPMEQWLDAYQRDLGFSFQPWQSDARWGLGFTFFKGRRMRGELEMAFQDRRAKATASDGSEWKATTSTLSFSLGYGLNLVSVPAPVVPVVSIGGALDMADFTMSANGAEPKETAGAFSANGLAGTIRARAGVEFFLSPEYTLGVYACQQVGTRTTLYVSDAGDPILDQTMNLPTADSFAASPANPSSWTDLRYSPNEIAFYASLRYNFRLSRAPGVAEP